MLSNEKKVAYTIQNTYSTLNKLNEKTKYVWFVCHGLGFLSRYFIQYFNELNPDEHYIIAPQAQSKHYLKNEYKHVGTTWLTKENTAFDIENVLQNIDTVYAAEQIPKHVKFIALGFSQGVSILTRWVAKRAIPCHKLVLYAGKIPREFTQKDFKHIPEIKLIVGNQDEYVTSKVLAEEKKYSLQLFDDRVSFLVFDGTHEMKNEIINNL